PREFLDHRNLLAQRLRHFLPLRLVFRQQRQPILRSAQIEKHQNSRRFFLFLPFPDRLHPTMQRIGRKPTRPRQLRNREKTTVSEVESINQQPGRHPAQSAVRPLPAQTQKPPPFRLSPRPRLLQLPRVFWLKKLLGTLLSPLSVVLLLQLVGVVL